MPTSRPRWSRPLWIAAVAVALLVLTGIGGWLFVQHELGALARRLVGPRGSIAEMHVSLAGLHLHGVRIGGDRSGTTPWPTDDEARIDDLYVEPDLRSYFGRDTRRIRRIDIHGGTLVVVRDRQGKVHILPSLIKPKTHDPSRVERTTVVDVLQLDDVALDMFDGHVRSPAHHLRIEHIGGHVGPERLPTPDLPMTVDLRGVGKGVRHDGQITLAGHLVPTTREADLTLGLAGIDLVALQPYLLKVNEGGVEKGDLDLHLRARVTAGQLDAPGTMTLRGLELAEAHKGLLSTFAGLPRKAVLASMTRNGRIHFDFRLQGRLEDPKFQLDDLSARIAGELANAVGVTIGGVVEGVGDLIDGALKR